MQIYLFCFEDDRNQWGDWQKHFFTPLVQQVLPQINNREVRLLLAHDVRPEHYWGYRFVKERAQPVGYPLSLQVKGQEFVFHADDGQWAPTKNQEFRLVPWPEGGPQGAVGPHMIVADVMDSHNTEETWQHIQSWARAAAYPWDMVWSASLIQLPAEAYGFCLPKFWQDSKTTVNRDPLLGFIGDRLTERLKKQKNRKFYYTDYPPKLQEDVYEAMINRQWAFPDEWKVVDDWQKVASPGGGDKRLFVVRNFQVPTKKKDALRQYLRFLNGEIFAIRDQGLLQSDTQLSEDALWLLMCEFCGALADGRIAEFRSYYIALRTLVPNLSNQWLQPIAKLRPETRPVHEKLNASRLSQLRDPILKQNLETIWRRFREAAQQAPPGP